MVRTDWWFNRLLGEAVGQLGSSVQLDRVQAKDALWQLSDSGSSEHSPEWHMFSGSKKKWAAWMVRGKW